MDDAAKAAKAELSHELVRHSRVIHIFRNYFAEVLPAGLDPAAGQLLAWLVKMGPSRQGELAECTFLDPSTVSRRISQLVQHGLVERRADPADGRAVQLVPTALGEQRFAILAKRREEVMQHVLAGWSETEISTLSKLLGKFNDDFETFRFELNSTSPGASAPLRPPTPPPPPAQANPGPTAESTVRTGSGAS
jgi:DNA-binding MarR family transcriptional regulator